jgi:hypothetical protein
MGRKRKKKQMMDRPKEKEKIMKEIGGRSDGLPNPVSGIARV